MIRYKSGKEIHKGDKVSFGGQRAEVELVVNSNSLAVASRLPSLNTYVIYDYGRRMTGIFMNMVRVH